MARKIRIDDNQPFGVTDKSTDTIGLSTGKDRLFAVVSKKSKEVIQLGDQEPVEQARKLLHPGNRKDESTASFIDEIRAKAILTEIAIKIGLPGDAVDPSFSLDKYSGLWTAKWTRKQGTYTFYSDYVLISISAVSGAFCNYVKHYETLDFDLKVVVSRQEAIKMAFSLLEGYLTNDAWEKNNGKFEVKNAELQIVKPNGSWRHFVPFYSPRARLAWVIVLDAKDGQGRNTVGILIKDNSTVILDAASGDILRKEINIVP